MGGVEAYQGRVTIVLWAELRRFNAGWELKPDKLLLVHAEMPTGGRTVGGKVEVCSTDYSTKWSAEEQDAQAFHLKEDRQRLFVVNYPLLAQGLGICSGLLEGVRRSRGRPLPPIQISRDKIGGRMVDTCLQNFLGYHGTFEFRDSADTEWVVHFDGQPVLNPDGSVGTIVYEVRLPFGANLHDRKPIQAMQNALSVIGRELQTMHRELAPPPPKEIKTWLDHWT